MSWSTLSFSSLWNRRGTAALTLLMVALSLCLLLTVDRMRVDVRASFTNTISGTDLVIGGRTGALNLLLYSVFRIGNATNNISWKSYQDIDKDEDVDWTVPLSLGDSHKGFRVLGTNQDYFTHYQYGRKQKLAFANGQAFKGVYDVVLGAEVASTLGYQMGDLVVIAHGLGNTSFALHDDKPFHVVGILAPTGTPVDRTLHVPLEGIIAIHIDWRAGVKLPGFHVSAEDALNRDLTPASITAVLVGMKSRIQTFRFQRHINEYRQEPLSAIIPGVALQELWQMLRIAENGLMAVSLMVVVTGLLGMVIVILAGLNERRREMAIFRALGARASDILGLLMLESTFYGVVGLVIGFGLHWLVVAVANIWIQPLYGIELTLSWPESGMLLVLAVFVSTSCIIGCIPGWKAYRQSLNDGLATRT